MAVAVCGDDAGDVSAGAGGVWGVGGGGEGCGGVGRAGGRQGDVFASRCGHLTGGSLGRSRCSDPNWLCATRAIKNSRRT